MSSNNDFATLRNGQTIPRTQVPEVPFADFRRGIVESVAAGQRIAALFGEDLPNVIQS